MNFDTQGIPKIAVAGAGYWGKNLVRNFAGLGALAMVCDSDLEACSKMAQAHPGIATCKVFAEILATPKLRQ